MNWPVLDAKPPGLERPLSEQEYRDALVTLQLDGEAVSSEKAWDAVISRQSPGRVLSLTLQRDGGEPFSVPVKASMSPDSARARWIAPLDFIADLFLRLLKMLIVPLILTSIISGVVSVGDPSALGRIGLKTMGYYLLTSLLAIIVGLATTATVVALVALLALWVRPPLP